MIVHQRFFEIRVYLWRLFFYLEGTLCHFILHTMRSAHVIEKITFSSLVTIFILYSGTELCSIFSNNPLHLSRVKMHIFEKFPWILQRRWHAAVLYDGGCTPIPSRPLRGVKKPCVVERPVSVINERWIPADRRTPSERTTRSYINTTAFTFLSTTACAPFTLPHIQIDTRVINSVDNVRIECYPSIASEYHWNIYLYTNSKYGRNKPFSFSRETLIWIGNLAMLLRNNTTINYFSYSLHHICA